jgi:hypothetical protein
MLKEIKVKNSMVLEGTKLNVGDVLFVDDSPNFYFKETELNLIPLGIKLNEFSEPEYLIMINGSIHNFKSINEKIRPLKKIKESFEYMLYYKKLPPLEENYIPIRMKVKEGGDTVSIINEKKALQWLKKNTK